MLPLNPQIFSSRKSFFGLVICWLIVLLCLAVIGCGLRRATNKPSVEVTRLPDADAGGRPVLENISGRVMGAGPEDRIVLFARSGEWYVQPFVDQPFTKIQTDAT